MSDTFTTADIETAAASATTADAPAAASTPEPSTSPASAATAPVEATDDLNDPGWGQIPQSRRQAILDNARKKAREEREAELTKDYESKYGWAKDIDPNEAAVVRDWIRRGNTDPAGLVADLFARVQSDPTHGARLRSEAARILSAGRQAQPAQEDSMPPPDIPTDASNGQPVVYSVQQQQKLLAWQERQILARVQQQLAPYQQDLQTRQQADEWRAMQAQSDAYAARSLEPLQNLPGFKDSKDAIAKEYAAMGVTDPRSGQIVPDPQDPRSEGEKLWAAYMKVVGSNLPNLGRQQAVADLHRKANASTVNPSQTNRGEPFDYQKASWEEALAYEWNRRKTG